MTTFQSDFQQFDGLKVPNYKCVMNSISTTSLSTYRGFLSFDNHEESKSNGHVTELVLTNCKIDNFGSLSKLSSVSFLTMEYCHVTTEDFNKLGYFKCLVSLTIIHNDLEIHLTKDILELARLKKLVITKCKIVITDGFTEKLKTSTIRIVDFRNNQNFDVMFDATSVDHRSLKLFISKLQYTEEDLKLGDGSSFFIKGNKSLWDSGELSDFIIKCGDREFRVHKSILAANSIFFRKMFSHEVTETKESKMIISDFNENTIEEFLLFLYIYQTPKDENLLDLFAVSSKYDVEDLRSYCEKKIRLNINDENAGEILEVANLYDSSMLKKETFVYIGKMLKRVGTEEMIETSKKSKTFVEAASKVFSCLKLLLEESSKQK